jgi:hypothetical protein
MHQKLIATASSLALCAALAATPALAGPGDYGGGGHMTDAPMGGGGRGGSYGGGGHMGGYHGGGHGGGGHGGWHGGGFHGGGGGHGGYGGHWGSGYHHGGGHWGSNGAWIPWAVGGALLGGALAAPYAYGPRCPYDYYLASDGACYPNY